MAANPLIVEYLLSTVACDYENIAFIRSQITQWSGDYQKVFSEEALLEAIDEAAKSDLIRPYKFNSKINFFGKCPLAGGAIDDYWFLKSGALGYPHNL